MGKNKVFVSGCFDVLHSGHIAFLRSAKKFGDLYVSVGSDKTVNELKGGFPIYNEKERLLMIKELRCVKDAFIAKGSGKLDFIAELKRVRPDIFVVNDDGDSQEKRELLRSLKIKYNVLKRVPILGLPVRSSTVIKEGFKMPYRIDLAGGWLDQPYVSKYCSGPVLIISIEADREFNSRSGMATSTRNKAIEIWGNKIPPGEEKYARLLFSYENPPGITEMSGSQDAIGIIMPGLSFAYYNGKHWPMEIKSINDKNILDWIEDVIHLIPLGPRKGDVNILGRTRITKENAKRLSEASHNCFNAIMSKDVKMFGEYLTKSFEAQIKMFPKMVNGYILKEMEKYKRVSRGWKLAGAGGGGYLILVSEKPIQGSISIKIRR